MFLVKVIDKKDVKWLKNGETVEMPDERALHMQREGIVKIIEDLGRYNQSEYYLRRQIESYKKKIIEYQQKIAEKQEKLRKIKNANPNN